MPIYQTTLENDQGGEFDVRIHYDYQPAEPATLEYPGCDESVEITDVEVWDGDPAYFYNPSTYAWQDRWDEYLDHHAKWAEEILEEIHND